jgi:membrane protein implicated in regulation of membrane protease activity
MHAITLRITIMAAAILVAAVFFVATGAFLCVALYEAMKLVISAPSLAALATAAILLLLALAVLSIGAMVAKTVEKQERKKRGPATAEIGLELGRILGEQVSRYAGRNPIRVLAGALVAGLAIGLVPSLRGILMRFFRG